MFQTEEDDHFRYEDDGIYSKYAKSLTNSQAASIRSAKSALNKLATAFRDGDVDA